MSVRDQLDSANLLILNGKFNEAEELLNQLAPESRAELRMRAHLLAIIEFHRGQFAPSLRRMLTAATEYGDNVSLLRDTVVCQYHLNDMQGFRASLQRLENQLVDLEAQLGTTSLLESELMVGKFLEEEARLVPAMNFYERALNRADKPSHRLRALIQKARWLALYDPLPELSNHYRELISTSQESLTRDLEFELEHSLMLIELRLIGSDHAWQRVHRLLPKMDEIDQRLMIFDFIEGALTQELTIAPCVLQKANEFNDLDPFEELLKKLAKGSLEHENLLHGLVQIAPKLPWASHLRLLCISANQERNGPVRQELYRKINLIVRGLDQRSQILWTKRLRETLKNDEIRIEFSARNRTICIQGKVLDLAKKKIGLQLLERLTTSPSLTVDEAIELLWQSPFSPEHYHRLRMSIHRLNTLIDAATKSGKVLEVDSQNVRLRPEVRMRATPTDEVFNVELSGV